MSESEIKPTKAFIAAVDEALGSTNPRKSLEQVSNEFGQFWCKKLGIGGSILYEIKEEFIVDENKNSKNIEGKIEVGIGGTVGKSEETNQMNTVNNKYSYFQIRGGSDKLFYEQGLKGWIASLENDETWEVAVYYPDIQSIFDILGDERRAKVAAALGKQIIDSQVVQFNFRMDISKPHPYIYEIPKQYALSNCQFFVTEMKDDDKSDTIFASRVHYISSEEPPIIILHRLGSLNKKQKLRTFSIKLGRIVLGTSTMLPQKLVFKSGETQITAKNEYCSVVIPSHELDPNESLLATYVSRSKGLQDNYKKSIYVTRSHFVYNNEDNAIHACAFCYDLENQKLFYQLNNLQATFLINYSVISGSQIDELGQAQIKLIKPFYQTATQRHKIELDSYCGLTKPCLQSPIFVCLVLDKCPKVCPHGVFNITPNYAEFMSIDSLSTNWENRRIAYFRAPIWVNEIDV
ncbi:4970_t:CDS:2 [Ambispora leptoticha]|uniref:4970_t:CDS:1 n=1 Tax=Ambispora leptoticha TaxID=144679 RepID=A0A9N9GL15_9GLOM|nr:4970_t:CDS:2 [Ambispora leptoticha]